MLYSKVSYELKFIFKKFNHNHLFYNRIALDYSYVMAVSGFAELDVGKLDVL